MRRAPYSQVETRIYGPVWDRRDSDGPVFRYHFSRNGPPVARQKSNATFSFHPVRRNSSPGGERDAAIGDFTKDTPLAPASRGIGFWSSPSLSECRGEVYC